MKRIVVFISMILVLSSCGEAPKKSNEINLYSQRHYKVDEQQYKVFEKETGIKVNVVKANADELIERLKNEGENSPADLFITVDAGKLQKAKDLDLLQKISSPIINQNVDVDLKDVNGYWIPITYRARIVVYSKDRVDISELSTYDNLTDEKWRNKVLVRSSSNAYNQALLSSIIANTGEESATKWASKLVKNFARDPKGNDRDQVKAITAGQGDLAIVNSYYIGLLLSSENEEEIKAGNSVGVFFPNQGEDESGSHINVSGIGLAKNAPNKENAIKLMEFLTSESAQKTYTDTSYEYPANPNVEPNEIVKKWGSFKKDILDLNKLGVFRNKAIEIFDKSDWK
ncbi:Fe(3+) ABC transporter substrate-binding protein [Flavobacteriaceae bacterium]|mgnify:FL=1|jgi:iron(III) transport system substrate-binding protein|nr:Fe(3+) ABC transporter substrate-binding protein [Flavobacteriaceae bacterium]MDC1179958.1 Fe(3+) ABC transporter substrate-binding protein [Flavobacteriaceae bacterium]MDC1372341.1 Fe(3+) ABC transporter substrate-binding protein [Flavobacteriaceae bacterium]